MEKLCGMKKRIGIFGGAFNPIHIGHIALANVVRKHLPYDKFMFVPTFEASHKFIEGDFDDRCKMVEMCIDPYTMEVSQIEKYLGKPTITFNLIMAIVSSQVEPINIDLIIGFDQFESSKTWDYWETILEHCRLIVLKRGRDKYDIVEIKRMCQNLYPNDEEEFFVPMNNNSICVYGEEKVIIINDPEVEIPDISSTQIRKCIKENEDIHQYVTPDVMNYIKNKKMYRN